MPSCFISKLQSKFILYYIFVYAPHVSLKAHWFSLKLSNSGFQYRAPKYNYPLNNKKKCFGFLTKQALFRKYIYQTSVGKKLFTCNGFSFHVGRRRHHLRWHFLVVFCIFAGGAIWDTTLNVCKLSTSTMNLHNRNRQL